jgi:hypothetical protein
MWKCENDLHYQNFLFTPNAGLNLIFTFSHLHIYTLLSDLASVLTLDNQLITSFPFCSCLQAS